MDSLENRLLAARAQLELQAPRVVLTMAQSGLALAVNRLQTTGIPGASYSTKPLPKFYFKPTNAAGRAYVQREKKPTYRGIRAAQGMETGFVNATYSGRMLRSLIPVPAGGSAGIALARVVASDEENQRKLGHIETRYGKALDATAREQQLLDAYVQRELDQIIQQALNG